MSKRTPNLDWQFAESEADWNGRWALPEPDTSPANSYHQQRIFWRIVALLLLLASAGGGREHIDQAILPAANVTADLIVTGEWHQAMQKDNGNHTAVPTYAPDAALWGPERSQKTLFVTFYYRQYDELAVLEVAPQVNNLYAMLRRTLGLPLTTWTEKLVIDVSLTQPLGQISSWFNAGYHISVPSPALYSAPAELTDAELLARSIVLALLEHVQARKRYEIGAARQPLLGALALWHMWELELPLAAWREDIVRWLYANEPAIPPGQPVVLPDHYEELCAAHTLWMPSPAQLGIPLSCTELDWQNWYYPSWGPRDPPLRLDHLTLWVPPDEYIGQLGVSDVPHPGQTVALATLIEYAVATYGHERLPALVAGLGQYDSWETLLPAVFGVSADEFEVGWQAYLATHYGVSLDILKR